MTDDKFTSPDSEDDLEATSSDETEATSGDPQGDLLADDDLVDPGSYEIAADETEAEELEDADQTVDDTPDKGDPADVVIDDESQLSAAESVAAAARSSRPVRKKASTEVAATSDAAPAKKGRPTPKRDAKRATVVKKERTTPAAFVGQSVGELKKVIWPSGEQLGNYFIVVLVFVLFIIAYVGLLDFGFGWSILKLFGAKPK